MSTATRTKKQTSTEIITEQAASPMLFTITAAAIETMLGQCRKE